MISVTDQENRTRSLNREPFDCEICGNVFEGSWTDYHGEATCNICGAPYQLIKTDSPQCTLKDDFKKIFKEYWKDTHHRCRLGMIAILRDYPGITEERRQLQVWLKKHHPEWTI